MTKVHRFLAFDCGATSGRGVLATFADGRFEMKEAYRFPSEMIRRDGRMYWDVPAMREHFVTCLEQLERQGIRPDSIGIDTWGVDFGCVGADGSLLGLPRCYRDPYTVGIPEKVYETIPREELYARTGIQIMNFNSIFQLYAQTLAEDESLKKARSILFMPDLLSFLLTGNKVCEYTDASTSGMMDQASRQFNKALLEELGIRTDMLLPIVQPGTRVGEYKGIPVIAVAGHDTASAIAAVPAADERFAYLSSGTWSLMGIEVPAPIINAESARLNFTNEGGIEGTTRFLKNITGMWLLEECRRIWKASGKDYSYAQLMEMARKEAGFPGRINPDDPRFAAPEDMVSAISEEISPRASLGRNDNGSLGRNDNGSLGRNDNGSLGRNDKCSVIPSNPSVIPSNPSVIPSNPSVIPSEVEESPTDSQIVSCIYHSLADRYKEVLEMLQGFAPFKIEKLHIIGGGSANELLNQWTADATGLPVVAGPVEATAIGNVMIQAKAAGLVKDRWEMRRLIANAFEVKTYYPSVISNEISPRAPLGRNDNGALGRNDKCSVISSEVEKS